MPAPTILDVSTILECAKSAGGYAIQDREKQNTLYGGIPINDIPQKIFFVWKRVQNRYDKNPSDTSLRATANFLWDLLGKYGVWALTNLQMGGVVVTPVTNVSSYLVVPKDYSQFVVGGIDAPMNDGDTDLTITDTLIVPESQDGNVEIHLDGGELGVHLVDRTSYTVIYSPNQFLIRFNQGVVDGQLYQISYPVKKTLVYQSGTPTPDSNLLYTATVVGATTETLLNDGNIFIVPTNTQGRLFIELAGYDQDNNRFAGTWTYYVSNIGGVISLSMSDGGIYYAYADGDIGANIAITANSGLHGVEMDITGFDTKTIIANAKFTYSPLPV